MQRNNNRARDREGEGEPLTILISFIFIFLLYSKIDAYRFCIFVRVRLSLVYWKSLCFFVSFSSFRIYLKSWIYVHLGFRENAHTHITHTVTTTDNQLISFSSLFFFVQFPLPERFSCSVCSLTRCGVGCWLHSSFFSRTRVIKSLISILLNKSHNGVFSLSFYRSFFALAALAQIKFKP